MANSTVHDTVCQAAQANNNPGMKSGLLLVFLLAVAAPSAFAASATDQAVDLLCNKRIALLGELPSHGEARAFMGKAAVARALVERCGFDAVLFEAPVYGFVALEPARTKGKVSQQQLDAAIGNFWRASELSAWRAWLLKQANAGRLRLGGIDDQLSITSAWAQSNLPALVAAHVAKEARGGCEEGVKRHLAWSYDDEHEFDDSAKRALGRCSGSAAAGSVDAQGDTGFLLANFDSMVQREIGAVSAIERDAVMQRNLMWYLRSLPVGSNVVVWTANVHAAKRSGDLDWKPMGAWLAESFGDELGVVAFTALGGRSSMAGKPARELPTLGAASLEARALADGRDEAFLPATTLRDYGTVQSRLFGKLTANEWATRFDGVVVYRNELAPTLSAPKP
jgi:erythromycin esterase-like protein